MTTTNGRGEWKYASELYREHKHYSPIGFALAAKRDGSGWERRRTDNGQFEYRRAVLIRPVKFNGAPLASQLSARAAALVHCVDCGALDARTALDTLARLCMAEAGTV